MVHDDRHGSTTNTWVDLNPRPHPPLRCSNSELETFEMNMLLAALVMGQRRRLPDRRNCVGTVCVFCCVRTMLCLVNLLSKNK